MAGNYGFWIFEGGRSSSWHFISQFPGMKEIAKNNLHYALDVWVEQPLMECHSNINAQCHPGLTCPSVNECDKATPCYWLQTSFWCFVLLSGVCNICWLSGDIPDNISDFYASEQGGFIMALPEYYNESFDSNNTDTNIFIEGFYKFCCMSNVD